MRKTALSLKVIPNPATSKVSFEVRGMEEKENMMLTMTNAQGVDVFTMKLPISYGNYSNSMDISRFPRGIYYFKVQDKKEQVIQKVVLQ